MFLLCGIFSFGCFGREVCRLTNGFQIDAISHAQSGGHVVLQTATGSLEFPASEVATIEQISDGAQTNPGSISPTRTKLPSAEQALRSAAEAEGLPAAFVRSVARTESGYNQNAVSAKGAIGLMQLMPATASALGIEPNLLEQNAQGGAKYLRDLLLRYHGNAVLALAAYNAGPDAVKKYGGVPPYPETRHYIQRVLREYARQQHSQSSVKLAANASDSNTTSATN